MFVCVQMFCGEAVGMVYLTGKCNCDVVVVVVVVVPPSNGQFAFGDDVEGHLLEFGLAVVLSGSHANFG